LKRLLYKRSNWQIGDDPERLVWHRTWQEKNILLRSIYISVCLADSRYDEKEILQGNSRCFVVTMMMNRSERKKKSSALYTPDVVDVDVDVVAVGG